MTTLAFDLINSIMRFKYMLIFFGVLSERIRDGTRRNTI
jgi:hypothetical protein